MRRIGIEDLLLQEYMTDMATSPDEKHIAIIVQKPDLETDGYVGDIWLLERKSRDIRKLTDRACIKDCIWIDNDTLIFSSQGDDELRELVSNGEEWTCYESIDINSGMTGEYMRIPAFVTDIKMVNKRRFLVTALNNLRPESKEEEGICTVIEESPFWMDGGGYTNKVRNSLYDFDLDRGKISLLSGENQNVVMQDLTDEQLLYTAENFRGIREMVNTVFTYDLNTGAIECRLTEDKAMFVKFARILKGKIVALAADMYGNGVMQNGDFYILENGELEILLKHDIGVFDTVYSDHIVLDEGRNIKKHDDKIYYVVTEGKSSFIRSIDVEGNMDVLTSDSGSVNWFEVCSDEIVFSGYRNEKPQEIYVLEDGRETRISNFNRILAEERIVSEVEHFVFDNDGYEIDGYVIKPIDFNPDKKYPAVLNVHGGPKTSFGDVFYHEFQLWPSKGYYTIYCNHRGSDGRDNDFADISGKYGTIDYDDIMKFVDEALVRYPSINREKLAVAGISYGGFMTNWIIGHTDRFKCAISEGSITNWKSFIISDVGTFFGREVNASTMWEDPEKHWWHSPMKYANQVTTPTLFVHGGADHRCPTTEGMQMFTALKYFGVETRLVIFDGASHLFSYNGRLTQRIRRLEEMTEWLDSFLLEKRD